MSRWIEGLRGERDKTAANFLFRRYFDRLVARLRHLVRRRARSDDATTTLEEVLQNLKRRCYPALDDCDSLWSLLIDVAEKRSTRSWRVHSADKRRPPVPHLADIGNVDSKCETISFQQAEDTNGSSVEIEIEELVRHLSARLTDPQYRHLLSWELQGYSEREMKTALERKLGRRLLACTVRRWRERVREELRIAVEEDSGIGS